MAAQHSEPNPLIRQFSKQIAGHAVVKGSSKPGMMKHEDGSVLKPILPPPRGCREVNFYKRVFDDNCQENVLIQLRPLVPGFRGIFSDNADHNTANNEKIGKTYGDYIKLEDVTERFDKPCILDVKMGAKTYDSEASPEKIRRETIKYSGTKVFGFCIPGMRVYDLKTQKYICQGKEFGKSLNKSNIKDAFRSYLNLETSMYIQLIESFLIRLREVSAWFASQNHFHFFASSLLFVYDANCIPTQHSQLTNSTNSNDAQNSVDSLKNLTELRMIDFAHVFDAVEKDNNYIPGLNSLIELFEQFLDEAKSLQVQT